MKIDFVLDTGIRPDKEWTGEFYSLNKKGRLHIKSGYAFDGPSGPTRDTKSFMRGSLVHDVFYQIMRHGGLPKARKSDVDKLLRKMILEDGMPRFRAWYVYHAVRIFGDSHLGNDSIKKHLVAP